MERNESEKSYEVYLKIANHAAIKGSHDLAQAVCIFMIKNWPERVIAKGEAISKSEVPDPKLKT